MRLIAYGCIALIFLSALGIVMGSDKNLFYDGYPENVTLVGCGLFGGMNSSSYSGHIGQNEMSLEKHNFQVIVDGKIIYNGSENLEAGFYQWNNILPNWKYRVNEGMIGGDGLFFWQGNPNECDRNSIITAILPKGVRFVVYN
jgi:hypothetical protein